MWPNFGGVAPEGVVEFDVFRRVREVVLATDHMRELHFDVVDDIHKMENPRTVRSADRHVGVGRGIRHVELDATTNDVLDHHRFARRAETDGAAVLVDMPPGLKDREVFFVNGIPLALAVGTELAAHVRTLVPVEAEPFQAVENDLVRLGRVAFFIRVLDAEDELAAVFAGVEPIEEGGAGPADMEKAGGRWCEAGANGHGKKSGRLTGDIGTGPAGERPNA
jgi:hypothetical protein